MTEPHYGRDEQLATASQRREELQREFFRRFDDLQWLPDLDIFRTLVRYSESWAEAEFNKEQAWERSKRFQVEANCIYRKTFAFLQEKAALRAALAEVQIGKTVVESNGQNP